MNAFHSWEVGSEFHWLGLPKGPFLSWPEPHVWFALGRGAFLAVWRTIQVDHLNRKTLLIPDYFCPEVTESWENAGVNIRFYADDPRWPHPDWDTITPRPEDWVLAVNHFGIRDGKNWQNWHQQYPSIMLIEDHSHDPLSSWALNSSADYAFASLRKTFPAPDGAILWSPRNHPLPPEPQNQDWLGSAFKLAGMIWKKEYFGVSHRESEIKQTFRYFQIEGERIMPQSENPSLSSWSRSLLSEGFPQKWRIQREENVRLLLNLLAECEHITSLFSDWPSGHCPFNVVLVFESESFREALRSRIISKGIYAPVHWKSGPEKPHHAVDLSKRILTIPVDQRYNMQDIHRIASILKESINHLDILDA